MRPAVGRGPFPAIVLLISLSACTSLGEKAYRSGVSAYARGDLEAATHNLSRFVAVDCYLESGDPRCHEAELELARAYCREGRPAWSLPVYDKMLVWQTLAEVVALKRETDGRFRF